MKKRFLPFSLLVAILVLGQIAIADNGGHYVPRTQGNATAESFMGSLRANQQTGLIDPAWMLSAMQSNERASGELYWLSMGPDNMGGQTTAVLYDNQSNVVFIGSKGGGVYKTYNYGVTWHQVGNQDLMVSCMAQAADGTIYVGTGDCGSTAATQNGLDQQSYDNSFVGTGVYAITGGETISQLASTVPSLNEVEAWSFVNDIVVLNGKDIVAATNSGLMYSTDKGETWTNILEGTAMEVRATTDGNIVASVDGQIYIGEPTNLVCHSTSGSNMSGDTLIPTAAGILDIAIAPSNDNVIYAACINASGAHTGFYASYDKGAHWVMAFPTVTNNQGNNVYNGYGMYNHGLVVDPTNEGRIFVLGYNLWKLERTESGVGYYIAENLTGNTVFYSPYYIHVGLHALAFNPKNSSECYFGTDGGVYKATASNGDFTFSYSNRNYITSRMFNVGMSGKDTRVLAAGIDHGTVLIEGNPTLNTLGYGVWVNPTGYNEGMFSDASHAGSCAISNINPNTIFVTTKGGDHLYRSETAGEDWVSTNFLSSSTLNSGSGISTSSFRLPILLYEDFNDDLNPATVWYKNNTEEAISSGTVLTCISNNTFPFEYTLDHSLAAGDSIEVHDPISARLYIAYTDVVYMTRQALDFATETEWYKITQKATLGFQGEPLSMGISADGDHLFVGMKGGRLFRLSNLNTVVDAASGSISDTTGAYQVTTTEIILPTTGQCVTSVAVDPRDANKVIVTLGNYGNDTYVLYSTNALADEPTFTSKQGNLPKMPVYSSVIEMATGDVIIGTEHGIYSTSNIANPNWVADSHNMGDVPVMELKQQLLSQVDKQTINITQDGEFITDYPGVHNTGIIYAATYGRGVFRCENYKQESGAGVDDNLVVETTVTMYPNPVQSEAVVSFNSNGNGNVSLQVFDITGRMVMSQNLGSFTEGNQEVRVNMSNLSSGSYILRLNQGSNSACAKFLVY